MGGGFAYSGKITWKSAFFFLLTCMAIGVTLFFVTGMYDVFGPNVTTFVAEQPAKYEGGVFRSGNGQETVAELRFVTVTGEHIRVTGQIAKDMIDHQVTLVGNNYVYLSYEMLTQYTRSGKVQGKFHRPVSWKPLPYEEHTGISW